MERVRHDDDAVDDVDDVARRFRLISDQILIRSVLGNYAKLVGISTTRHDEHDEHDNGGRRQVPDARQMYCFLKSARDGSLGHVNAIRTIISPLIERRIVW